MEPIILAQACHDCRLLCREECRKSLWSAACRLCRRGAWAVINATFYNVKVIHIAGREPGGLARLEDDWKQHRPYPYSKHVLSTNDRATRNSCCQRWYVLKNSAPLHEALGIMAISRATWILPSHYEARYVHPVHGGITWLGFLTSSLSNLIVKVIHFGACNKKGGYWGHSVILKWHA